MPWSREHGLQAAGPRTPLLSGAEWWELPECGCQFQGKQDNDHAAATHSMKGMGERRNYSKVM